jgi:ABC-2 type transport system permease protein
MSTGTNNPVRETALRSVLWDAPRPPRPASAALASLTFASRVVLKIKHVPDQLTDVTLTPVLFTVMFTFLFGGALAGSTVDYVQFLLPGILVQTIVFSTTYTGIAVINDSSKGISDRFRSLPIWRPSPIVGTLLGDTVRYVVASTVVISLGLLLGFRPDGGVPGVLLSVLLLLGFAFGMGWVFTALGMVLRSTNAVLGVSMTVLFPLTFASNIFVDPRTMPPWLEVFVGVNPVSQLVTAVRALMAGTTSQVGWVLLASVLLVAVFGPLAMRLNRART